MSNFKTFVTVHQYQLASIPEELWEPLYTKLENDYLDAGNFVELHLGDVVSGYSVHTKKDISMEKHSNIFLVDHAWTTTPEEAKQQLKNNMKLLDRLEGIMNIENEEEEEEEEDMDTETTDEVVKMVAEQANVSYQEAKVALEAENYEVVNAIMRLTMDEEHKKEADRLHEQVVNQILASGRVEEKEQEERIAAEEKKKKKEQETLKKRVERIYTEMWSFLQTYSFSVLQQDGQPKSQTAWYICDEVGSALCHSSSPNINCVPFVYSRSGKDIVPYSVFFPVKNIGPREAFTCNLLPTDLTRSIDQKAYLVAFENRILESEVTETTRTELIQAYKDYKKELSSVEPPKSNKITDAQKATEALKETTSHASSETVYVSTTTPFVRDSLKLPNCKFVEEKAKADIIWYSHDYTQWESLKSSQTVNQFPNESCLTFKHNLSNLVQKTYGLPVWIPQTYNLVSQLGEVVGNYLDNEEQGKDNLWILKPWNLARGLDISISRSLPEIIRQHVSNVPKIAQEYLTKPCLYNGKKFDLRYIVLLRRTDPTMIACVYNMFWIRLANKRFNLEDLDDYERQFTVMNYSQYEMTQLDYKSFIYHMEKQHKVEWKNVQKDINQAMKDVLAAAAIQLQPLGLASDTSSTHDAFSIYGFDIMLTEDYKPQVIEVNFSPDCTRACKYDPEFVNNIFSLADGRLGNVEKGLESFTVL
ncbi:tubulin-tyrosine ligase family-domain-containing protein [Spinellus fusiger]|nr:tubulin-tyrosine ligase family-domain-containing protein [Spinellus fusiger]